MAVNFKQLIVDALLHLNETKHLTKITVTDILKEAGVSRQTFYNHFIDKEDLIIYVYNTMIIPGYSDPEENFVFYNSFLQTLITMRKYGRFMKEACMMDGSHCLKDYIFRHCEEFDLLWHQKLYGQQPMPQQLVFATKYHANASSSMVLSWILSDFPATCEEIARLVTDMRSIGMDELFRNGEHTQNPYRQTE